MNPFKIQEQDSENANAVTGHTGGIPDAIDNEIGLKPTDKLRRTIDVWKCIYMYINE